MEMTGFRERCVAGKIRWTQHALSRLQERDITVDDVKNCIMKGEIIEEYPNDFPHPSALIFGYNLIDRVIHTVCGMDENFLYIITAYEPTPDRFMDDLKTRRQT